MIHIEWPELFFILPLPLLVRWLLPAQAPTVLAALKVPFIEDFGSAKTGGVSEQRPWLLGVAVMAWVLLVIASSRPQFGITSSSHPRCSQHSPKQLVL